MYGTPKQKLTEEDKRKIRERFSAKLAEFKAMSAEELKPLLDKKMSSTDKYARDIAIDEKIKANVAKKMEEESTINKQESNGSKTDEPKESGS